MFNKGTIVFSADFEMAWASRFSKKLHENAVQIGIRERIQIPEILKLFNKYDIPVTWATVGHLFLKKCEKRPGSIPHRDMIRPSFFENRNWKYNEGDWYQHDPCSNVTDAPAWYAPDLINMIISSKTNHEIACHTFSHCDFSKQNCPEIMAKSEIQKCINVAKDYGIKFKSMVFPGGTYGNFKVLKDCGFICYRMPFNNHISMPVVDDFGLVRIPSSHMLEKDPYNWSVEFHFKILDKFIQKTIDSGKLCHFWFHPSLSGWYIDNILPLFLEKVYNERNMGNLEVLTMKDVANKVLKHD